MADSIGYGKEKRREGNLKVLSGEATFRHALFPMPERRCANHGYRDHRDVFREMLDSVAAKGHTYDECKEFLKKCTFVRLFLRNCALEV